MASLTVSIVNTRQWGWLEPCIRSLLEHPYTLGRFEIVVLDNASDDGSVEQLRTAFPDVTVLAEQRRRGFGANHNIVARAADTDLVMFLNPDTLMTQGALDRLAEVFAVDERIFAAGGPILDPDGTVWRDAPFEFPTPAGFLREALLGGEHSHPAPAGVSTWSRWLSGSALMVDRRVFLSVGGFDERFFLYWEETDLAKRLVDAGGLVGFDSGAAVVHEGRISEKAISSTGPQRPEMRTTTEYERSAIAYMRKHFGVGGSLIYRIGLGVGAGLRYAISQIPALSSKLDGRRGSVEMTRLHHKRRLEMAFKPRSGVTIGDAAAEWNRRNGAKTGTSKQHSE